MWGVSGLLLLACSTSSAAQAPSLDVGEYAHTVWRTRDGFTSGLILSMAQTPDGYLWLGTELGLVRFDGVRIVEFQPPTGQRLPDEFISALRAARDGTLWIGTRGGLASWKDGKLRIYREGAGQLVQTIVEGADGTIWFGLDGPGRLCAVRGGQVRCYGTGEFGGIVHAILEDRERRLWLGTQTGVWRWTPEHAERYATPDEPVGAQALIVGDDGAVIMASHNGLRRLVGAKVERYPLPGLDGQFVWDLLRSRDGSLWIATAAGLFHAHEGETERFTSADGLSTDNVGGLFEDREGNVWVRTTSGLDRFRMVAARTLSVRQGLSTAAVWSVQATPDGSVWLGTAAGLNRWRGGRVTVYGERARPDVRQDGGPEATNPWGVTGAAGARGVVYALGFDGHARLWASTRAGIVRYEGGRFVHVAGIPPGSATEIAADGDGRTVWIAHSTLGLLRWSPPNTVRGIAGTRTAERNGATALLTDRRRGGVWVGRYGGGLAFLADGVVRATYGAAEGLGGRVSQLRTGDDGAVWAATEGGLSRVRDDGRVATLTRRNGLPCDAVHWSIEDDERALWLYTPCGLIRVERAELEAWERDARRVVRTTTFDSHDGVPSRAIVNLGGPTVAKSADGRIWFVGGEGVTVLDPRHLVTNALPPPVNVEQITADGRTYDAAGAPAGGVKLPPAVRDLEIRFTALSLAEPEKVRFRYRLEGQDPRWREGVNVRRVEYSNLPPGTYRFRVTAANNSGVWNERGASVEFSIAPAYYQTTWFRALIAAVVVVLLWAAYRLRVRQLRLREAQFRDTVENMPAMAFITAPDGEPTFWSRRWTNYTGLTLAQTLGAGWMDGVHRDDLALVRERWNAAHSTGAPIEYEVRLRGADGEYRWFFTRAVPVTDRRGRVARWYGVATDIEDRKRADELQSELAHIDRVTTLGEMAASISHELKQPLTASLLNAKTSLRWLRREQPDVREASEAIERIVADGTRATEIISRLRALYTKAPTQREEVNVNDIVRELAAFLRDEASRRAVSIRTQLAAQLPAVIADRVQLQQVLMNLMLNGIEAMDDTGGTLAVITAVDDGKVTISVSDAGVGIPSEDVARVFDAFFTTKPHGSGMGLSISRTIVESHGGRIWAAANDGPGTTFHVSLPVAPGPEHHPDDGGAAVSGC